MTEQLNRRTVLQRLLELAIVVPLGWMGIHALLPGLGQQRRVQKRSLGMTSELFATKSSRGYNNRKHTCHRVSGKRDY